jgi:hypothetical protein
MHILHLSFLSEQNYGYGSNKGSHFQMVGPTRSSPNGFGASGSGDLPPPPMMPSEAFMATQTEVAPDPTDAAADSPAAEPEAATWSYS